jgi:hypothetical protein
MALLADLAKRYLETFDFETATSLLHAIKACTSEGELRALLAFIGGNEDLSVFLEAIHARLAALERDDVPGPYQDDVPEPSSRESEVDDSPSP